MVPAGRGVARPAEGVGHGGTVDRDHLSRAGTWRVRWELGEAPYWISELMFETILDRVAAAPARYRLSFDDGNASDHDIALPRLLARG